MVNEESIENFGKVLTGLEVKVRNLETDLTTPVHDERQHISTTNSDSSICSNDTNAIKLYKSESEMEIFLKKMQQLQYENHNLAEDLQEWKMAYNEKESECDRNREKYLQVQQTAEEYRRQLETINRENIEDPHQINSDLHLANERIKDQLSDLGRFPFMLEAKQLELQETISKLKLTEKTINALSTDLESCIVKCEILQKDLEQEKIKNSTLEENSDKLIQEINEWKQNYDKLSKENEMLVKSVEKMEFLEDCLESKTKELHELGQHLEQLREESLRHVSRIKERADTQKRAFRSQIVGLEQELVQLRSNLSTAFKERDEIRNRLQNDIFKLEQKFGDAQLEVRGLKNHIEILKTSYMSIFDGLEGSDDDENDEENSQLQ